MQIPGIIFDTAVKSFRFLKRQQRDWKITVVRASLSRFLYQIVFPYQSVYTVALGASRTQLGIVNSVGMGIAGLLGPLIGWLIDRRAPKLIYLIGIGLLVVAYLTYGLAQSWVIIILAMIAYQLGYAISDHACWFFCANLLVNKDRATGTGFCETISGGLFGIIGPMIGAFLVALFGGVNIVGIRPLFFVSLVGTIGAFLLILTQLSNYRWTNPAEVKPGFIKDFTEVFRQRHNLKRMLIIVAMTYIPYGMVLPFTQVFAHEVKGADEYVLGAMVSGMALTVLALSIPLGRLADRIGRKQALYLATPLFYVSSLLLIWAPNSGFLIAAGTLQGLFWILVNITGAMAVEIVTPEQMGRWLGIVRFFELFAAAFTALLAGLIWDNIGPEYLFFTVIGLDLFIRIPLLIKMPETLWLRRLPTSSQS